MAPGPVQGSLAAGPAVTGFPKGSLQLFQDFLQGAVKFSV